MRARAGKSPERSNFPNNALERNSTKLRASKNLKQPSEPEPSSRSHCTTISQLQYFFCCIATRRSMRPSLPTSSPQMHNEALAAGDSAGGTPPQRIYKRSSAAWKWPSSSPPGQHYHRLPLPRSEERDETGLRRCLRRLCSRPSPTPPLLHHHDLEQREAKCNQLSDADGEDDPSEIDLSGLHRSADDNAPPKRSTEIYTERRIWA